MKSHNLVPLQILHVEDSSDDHFLVERYFQKNQVPVELQRVDTGDDFEKALSGGRGRSWDAILCDHHLPNFSSSEALRFLKQHRLDIPFLLVSGAIGEMGVLEAMKAGAHDYIPKDDLLRLIPAIRREIRDAGIRKEKAASDEQLRHANDQLRNAVETLTTTQNQLGRIERLRALGEIASGVAHDFNNSLTKILGIGEILAERCPDEQEALRDLFSVAHDSTKVVQRLRNFYMARSTSEDAKPVDVNEILKRAIELSRPKWDGMQADPSCRIRCEFLPTEVRKVSADDSELRELITNLIFNAVDALQGRKDGIVTLSSEERDGFVTVAVADNGSGMDPEVLQRCREPFFTTKGENGTGLGLGLADSVIRRFGGNLQIESQPAHGTTIRIQLPAATNEIEELSETEPVEEPSSARRFRVLIVDDDPTILKLMKKLLEMDGHQVSAIETGSEALRQFDSSACELVITDCDMPIMDGSELSRRLKERHPLVPVIMSTGHSDIGDEDWPDTIDFLLPKPVSRSGLRHVLSQVSLS